MLEAEPDIRVVGEADNGRNGVRVVKELSPSVVMLDIRMPELDGIEATKQIRVACPEVGICILTNYGTDDLVYDALAAGASGFLVKTDSPERIVATVRAVAAGEFALGTETTAELVGRFLQAPLPDASARTLVDSLTDRERDVFELVAQGLSNSEIAARLFLGEGTVKTHVTHILLKFGMRDRIQVVVFAHRNNLVGG
jgi:DNA-binding NarL/FixJ family response regulator